EPLVRPVVIEMAHVLLKNSVGVSLVVDQQLVDAFGTDAADEAFRVAVRPGRAGRGLDDVDTYGGEDGVEGVGEFRVPVADEEAKRGNPLAQEGYAKPGDELCDHVADLREHRFLIMFSRGF